MGRDNVDITENKTANKVEISLRDDWHEDDGYTDVIITVSHKWLGLMSLMANVDTYAVGKKTPDVFYYSESPIADFSRVDTLLTGDGLNVRVESSGNEIKITPIVSKGDVVEHEDVIAFERYGYSDITFKVIHPETSSENDGWLEEHLEMTEKTKAYAGL